MSVSDTRIIDVEASNQGLKFRNGYWLVDFCIGHRQYWQWYNRGYMMDTSNLIWYMWCISIFANILNVAMKHCIYGNKVLLKSRLLLQGVKHASISWNTGSWASLVSTIILLSMASLRASISAAPNIAQHWKLFYFFCQISMSVMS